MLDVFRDLQDEDGVVIRIIEEDTVHAKKGFDVGNDDLSGYLI